MASFRDRAGESQLAPGQGFIAGEVSFALDVSPFLRGLPEPARASADHRLTRARCPGAWYIPVLPSGEAQTSSGLPDVHQIGSVVSRMAVATTAVAAWRSRLCTFRTGHT
jgi:hypothetical protein